MTTYRERLHVPLRWWAQGVMFIATLWLALIVAVPPAWAWTTTAISLALLALGFVTYGAAAISVDETYLDAGTARIELVWVGRAEALDKDATRRTAGMDADARAFLLLRPYRSRAVKVAILDPADPTPYWLISTRHPRALAEAINAAVASAPSH